MDIAIKAAIVGLGAVAAALTLKRDNPAGAFLLALGAGAVILGLSMNLFLPVYNFLRELSEAASIDSEFFSILYKVLAISIITYVSADACRDAGERAIAGYIELAGGAAALYVSLPLLSAVFSLLRSFLR